MWYNRVVQDLGNIPDFINYYENELLNAKYDCSVKGNLEKNIASLPGVTEQRFNQLQEIEAVLNFLNIQLRKIRRKHFQKYLEGTFGSCPRALCDNQKCIPVGLSEKLRNSRVKIFCPKCDEVYMVQKAKSPSSGTLGAAVSTATNLDGSYFGCSFP